MTQSTPWSRRRQIPLAFGAFSVAILLIAYARFNGINDVIQPFLQRATDPSLYALDSGIQRSMVPASSQAFRLIDLFHVDLTGPLFIIGAYVVTCLVSMLAVDLISRRIFGITQPLLRIFILFATLFADGKLINLNKSSWILDHNFSFTFLAASLRFWFLYFFLRGSPVAMGLMLVPINILSFKVGWPLSLMAAVLLVHSRSRSPLAWGVLLLGLIAPGAAAIGSPVIPPPGEAGQMFDLIRTLHASEDNPFLGSPLQLFLFPLASLAAWHVAARDYPAALAKRFGVILFIGLFIFAGGGIVLTFDWVPLKLPVIVLLSPARALEGAAFIIYVILLVKLLTVQGLSTLERSSLLMGLIILKLTPSLVWAALSALFLLLAALLRWGAGRKRPANAVLGGAIPAISLIATAAPLIGIFFAANIGGNRAQPRHDPLLGFYDSRIPADTRQMLRAVASQRTDRLILFGGHGQSAAGNHWNLWVRKSGITGDPYYLPRLADIQRQRADNALFDAVQDGLAQGHIPAAIATSLAERRVSLIVPSRSAAAVPGWRPVRRYGSWVELAPRPGAAAPGQDQRSYRPATM